MSIRIGIIGGGAAGLFAACQFKRLTSGRDIDVTLIEKNAVPGIKLTLTGHGRCNITNLKEASELKNGYHEAGNFIYPALRQFGPEDTMRFFEDELRLPLKEEDNNRIFPVCDSAVKVRDALASYISDSTKIITNTKVSAISKASVFEVTTDNGRYDFDFVILSCGGSSFTGLCSSLSGVPVSAAVSVWHENKKIASYEGEVLFAEFGLTGPAVMEISREIPADIHNTYLELDLVPSVSDEEFDRQLQVLIDEHADTKMSNLLSRYIPSSVAAEITSKTGTEDMYAQGFTRENRKKICREMKHLKIGIGSIPDIDKAYVTRGGVSLREVERKTMGSKLVPGLYIIGEALDIDGISGGYNLQACMSEAYLAAKSILEQ